VVYVFTGIMTVKVVVLDALISVERNILPDRDCSVTLQVTITPNLAKCSL
jgi:hypothetical protein